MRDPTHKDDFPKAIKKLALAEKREFKKNANKMVVMMDYLIYKGVDVKSILPTITEKAPRKRTEQIIKQLEELANKQTPPLTNELTNYWRSQLYDATEKTNTASMRKVEKAENMSATKWTKSMERYIAKKILNVQAEQ
jgi:hypothetical protein